MTNEERDIITRYIERVGGGQRGGFAAQQGNVPALPPIDREADALIADLFSRYPEARYRLTQTSFVQEQALNELQARVQRLEADLDQLRRQPPPDQQQSRGFLGGLFGGGPSRPQPQYQPPPGPQGYQQAYPQQGYQPPPGYGPQGQFAPGYQPGMFQRSGSGFLGSALTTAAGVAGGMVAGNALMGLFSGHHGGGFGAGDASAAATPAIEQSPWAGASAPAAPMTENWDTAQNQGAGWDSATNDAAPSTGWDTAGNDQGGGWDDAAGGGFDDSTNDI